MTIPAEILAAAAGLVDVFGPSFELLGEKDGAAVYHFVFPEDSETGYPFLYLLKDGKVREVTGEDALALIGSLGAE